MRIIIAYASVGSGHLKAAEALYQHFTSFGKDFEVRITDSLGKKRFIPSYLYCRGYMLLVKYAPFLWKAVFNFTSCFAFRRISRVCMRKINLFIGKDFYRLLKEYDPGIIISTHFLPADIAAFFKKREKRSLRAYTVITDFGVHPFWVEAGIDSYFVASRFTKEKLTAMGVEDEMIVISGIPVKSEFLCPYDRASVAKQLKIDGSKFTVLISTGSFAIGPVEKIIKVLAGEVQFIVVCAANKSLLRRLQAANYPSVFLYGYTNIMPQLMAVCDCILTKPGGLTVSECLAMELMPLFITAIPGQERKNLEFLSGNNIGILEDDPDKIKQIILHIKNTAGYLSLLKDRIRRIKKPDAAGKIYDAVCKSSPGIAR